MTYKKTYIPAHENEEFKHKWPKSVGRPKKTLADLPKDWEKKVMDLADQGACVIELCVYALDGISRDLFNRFYEEEPKFSLVINKTAKVAEAWWRQQGRINLENKEFQTKLYVVNMINRFDGFKSTYVHSQSNIDKLTTHVIKTVSEVAEEDMKLIEEISDRTPKD